MERGLFGALVLLLIWVPIPLGSNRPWAWALLEVAVMAILAAWSLLWAIGRVRASEALVRAWPALAVLAAWLAHVGLTIVPLPAPWIELLSPESARMQRLTDAIGIVRESMTLSVDPAASRGFLLKSIAYTSAFVLVLALANSRARIRALTHALVYAAVVQAAYAILMHLGDATSEHFGTVIHHGPRASGTYVNPNHLAGYLEVTLAIGIGLMIAGLSDRRSEGWRKAVRHLLEWMLSPRMMVRLALCVLVVALTATHSRMGNAAFFAALLVTGLVGIALSRHATRNTVILLASLVAIDLAILGSWFGIERVAQRIEQTTVGDVRQREEPAEHALAIVRDYPVFGAGPGSFYGTFPRYRPETITEFFDYTHNDFVQVAAETGILGLGLLGLLVAMTLAAALRAQWQRRDPLMRGLSFACLMGVTSILIHSWVDFNLQIPANATLFMVLLALGWISLHHDRRGAEMPRLRQ